MGSILLDTAINKPIYFIIKCEFYFIRKNNPLVDYTSLIVKDHTREVIMNVFHYDGLLGLIILILDIWAIVNVIASNNGVFSKIIWVIVILILPILGFLIWLIFGPRRNR